MADEMVLKTQQWLNKTYGGKTGYGSNITENGNTGWTTIYALTRALQIELGITSTANNFGPSTISKFNARFPNGVQQQAISDETESNIYGIIQGACWCKGYSTSAGDITKHFYSGTGSAIKQLKSDAGCVATNSTVTLNVMKSLLSMDQFKLVSGGDETIRLIQRKLNNKYESYIGLTPCDGVYGRQMNKALIIALQKLEGYSKEDATGNFGAGTKSKLPIVPTLGQISEQTEKEAIELVRYALCCNGYLVDIESNAWTVNLNSTLGDFQKDMCIEVTGICDTDTWMALLLSKGNPDRKCIGCDTRFEMTNDRLEYLKNNGYEVVGRYLTGGDFKQLRPNEPQRILDKGLSFFPIFQESSTDVSYFTADRAVQDAISATNAAKEFRIPRRSIIYFAVDLDATDTEINSYVLPYFKRLSEYMSYNLHNYYRIGVYGTRNVCTQVMDKGYAVTCFVSDMSTGYSGNMGFKMPKKWNFDQFNEFKVTTSSGTWDLDKDAFSKRFGVVTRLDIPGEKDLYTKLKDLYDLADEYCSTRFPDYTVKQKSELVLQYLRSQHYNSNLWGIIAGEIDENFVNYVYDRVSSELHPENVTIYREECGEMKIPHLAATLNARLKNIVVLNEEADDLAGWAGDLIQLGGVIGNNECTEQDVYNLIGCNDNELAQRLLNVSAEGTGFGLEDFELDIAAVDLTFLIYESFRIDIAFEAFYENDETFKNRFKTFIHWLDLDFSGKEDLIKKLSKRAKKYTNIACATAVAFEEKFAPNFNKEKYGDMLAEQFAKKIADYYKSEE